MKPSIVLLLGPTGVGKSSIAIELAEALNAEIISADSIQVYKNVDIGSAKTSVEARQRVPHHLVDILDLDQPFDVARFVDLADEAIRDIHTRGKQALVVGGTNLYIRGLLHGIFEAPPADPNLREAHRAYAEESGIPALHAKLVLVDPVAAARIHENDLIRVSRALEIFALTGESISKLHSKHAFAEERYRSQKIVVFRDRENLYERIDQRVDQMLEEGIIEEYNLIVKSVTKELKALNSIGYRHIRQLNEGLEYEEFVRLFKRDTRRFAKNQLSWLRGEEAWWFHAEHVEINELGRDLERFFEGENEISPTWLGSPTTA